MDVRGDGLRELGRVVSVPETRGHFPPGEGKGKMSASFRAHIYRLYLLKYRYAVTMLFIATGFCKQERITYTLIEDMDGIYHLFQDASQDANNLFEAGRGSKTRSTFSRPGPYISKSQATFHSRHQYNFKTRSLFFKTRSLFFFKTRSFFSRRGAFFSRRGT